MGHDHYAIEPTIDSGPMYVVLDGRGRRVVMPRYTQADAIEQIARAVAGRFASPGEKWQSWERLRDQQGFRVTAVTAAVDDSRRSPSDLRAEI
jgi:hypothetical protein